MTTFADVSRFFSGRSEDDTAIEGASSASRPRPHTLSFVSAWDDAAAGLVADNPLTFFLVPSDAACESSNVAKVPRPRLAYALAVRAFLHREVEPFLAPSAYVAPTAELGSGVTVGHFCVIEDDVVVGDGTFLDSHVVLKSGVRIGRNTRVGTHTAIGGPGFGFEMDDTGRPIRIGHLGGVVIGDDVEIGAHVSIAQGTIDPTRIEDHVKIDDCVFIAHNVSIGEASYVIAGAEISGSVRVGKRVWISPEATITNQIAIGDDAMVGIGAVVVRDVEENTVVAGVPAKPRGLRHPEGGPR